jgi:hypothetical protein
LKAINKLLPYQLENQIMYHKRILMSEKLSAKAKAEIAAIVEAMQKKLGYKILSLQEKDIYQQEIEDNEKAVRKTQEEIDAPLDMGIDQELVDAIKSGDAWLPYGESSTKEYKIAMNEKEQEQEDWSISDNTLKESISIMEEIDKLHAEIEQKDISWADKKGKAIYAKIEALRKRHRNLWDAQNNDKSYTSEILNGKAAAQPKLTAEVKPEPIPMSRSEFHRQFAEAQKGKLTEEQITAQLEIADAIMQTFANEMGISLDQAYADVIESVTAEQPKAGTYLTRNQAAKTLLGYIQDADGKHRIGLVNPNITTGLHEMAHLGRSLMAVMAAKSPAWQTRLKAAEDWCGVKDGKWTTEAEEKFAKGFERYLYEGIAPNSKLKTAFEKIKQWMAKLIDRIAGIDAIQLDDSIRSVYGMMLGAEKVAKAETNAPVALLYNSDLAARIYSGEGKSLRPAIVADIEKMKVELDQVKAQKKAAWDKYLSYNVVDIPSMWKEREEQQVVQDELRKEYAALGGKEAAIAKEIKWAEVFLDFIDYGQTQKDRTGAEPDGTHYGFSTKAGEKGYSIESFLNITSEKLEYILDELDGLYKKELELEAKESKYLDAIKSHPESERLKDEYAELLNEIKKIKGKQANLKGRAKLVKIRDKSKPALTSQQKAAVVKVKAEMKGKVGSDPVALEKHLDRYINDKFKNLTMAAENKRGVYSLIITNIDTGDTALSIQHSNGEYEVNGYHAADNKEAAERAESILSGNKLLAQTEDIVSEAEIAEAERQMAEDADEETKPKVKDQISKQEKKARKAQATARRLRYRMGTTANVDNWDTYMRQSLTTLIRTMHPGATPINEQWVESLHYQFLDAQMQGDEETMAKLKRKVERMKKADAKFRRYLSQYSGGFEDVADIPFEQLFTSIQAISPTTYDYIVSGNTPQIILDLIPKLKQEFGDKYMDAIGWLVHYTHLGSSPYTGASETWRFAMQPHRLLARIMGKAGVELVGLGYQAGIQNRIYEHEYEPFLSRVHKLLLSPENNRGSAYMGEEIDFIGKTIIEVVNDLNVKPEQHKAEIEKRINNWNAKEESLINMQDVLDIYDASMDLMDLFRDYIEEWNANPKHEKAKIGILENYLPRSYRGEDLSSVVDKVGDAFLYRSKNAKRREKEELSKNRIMENNMFILLRNYAYEMSKYMAFYDFAEYAKPQITRLDKDAIIKRGSLMDQDISFLQGHTAKSLETYVRNYIRDTIGYHKAQKGWDRFISSVRTNAYSTSLSLNVLMIGLNWHQRWLIYSVVDRKAADYAMSDFNFWTGNAKMGEQMYPMLTEIMEQYKIHNLSLLADMLSEAKSMQGIGATKASRAYYQATASNAKLLQKSPFSKAEYGNRAWAHAAGVYQVLMNSPEYKQAMQTKGMTRHGAMEIALRNPRLRDAAIRYGGIVNAEVNADVNSSFAPSLFRASGVIKHILTFMRYSNTILLLKLRTYGGIFRKLESELSPDIFNMLTSGNATAANDAQLIQLAELMKQFTNNKRIPLLLKNGYISTTPGKGLITTDQMRSINEALSWALDTYKQKAKVDHADIVRNSKDRAARAAQLFGFDLAETMLRLLYSFLLGLIPWWMGKKKKIDPETVVMQLLQNVLPLKSMSYSLGQGIVPDIPIYNMDNPKVLAKEFTKTGMKITPYFGQINAVSKVFMGKYFTDIAWDEITEK